MNEVKIVSMLVLGSVLFCSAATEIFVDCTRPDDSGDGLTRATAKRTIQAAVNATATGTTDARNLITIYPGDYDEGGAQPAADNILARVSLKGKKYITLQAASDAETMPRIIGRHDPETSTGLGSNAVRCVYSSGTGIILKDLMFCNGATHSEKGSDHGTYGGAVCGAATMVGCVVSNCIGSLGGAMYQGTAHRTLFTCCSNVLRQTKALNCVFRNGTGYCVDYNGALVNCTIIGHTGRTMYSNEKPTLINCLVFDNVSARSTLFQYGYPTNCATDVLVNEKYAFLNGTGNVQVASPAFGGTHPDGLCPIATETKVVGAANVNLYEAWGGTSTHAATDFYGNPRKTNGKMNIGAVEATVAGPYKTIHVDPAGDDANSGFGPDRPKRTLLDACRTAVAMGTNKWTVLAAPGRYAEGSDYTSDSQTLRARCFVSNCVSLVSRDGKDVTFIVGASTNQNECGDGCAIRGAYMRYAKVSNLRMTASIRGFTFADCVVPNDSVSKIRGGAIFGNEATYCVVEDCFFTNCSSYSAAVQAASLRRCSAVDCDNLGNACTYHSCFFDTSKNSLPRQTQAIYNCTFLGTKKVVDTAYAPFYNCIFSGGCYASTGATVSNCLYSSTTALNRAATNIGSRVVANLKLNADGTLQKGSAAIDAAIEKNVSYTLDAKGGQRTYNGRTDIGAFEYDWRPDYAAYLLKNGHFTVTNATKTVTLDEANRPLGIKLGSGGTLAGVWTALNASTGRAGGEVRYKVTGNGSLKVYRDGTLVETLTQTEGDDWATVRIKSANPSMTLAFTYTAGSSDPGTAYLGALDDAQGSTLFVR